MSVNNILFLVLFFFVTEILSQNSTLTNWFVIHHDNETEQIIISDIKFSNNENIYLAGNAYTNNKGRGLYLAKYSDQGELIFKESFYLGEGTRITVSSITIDSEENIYLFAHKDTTGSPFTMFLNKYSSEGELLWSRNFNFPSLSGSMIMDENENPIISYISYGTNITKLSNNGDSLWTQKFVDFGLSDIVKTDDKGFLLWATSGYFAEGYYFDGELIKLNNTGEVLWSKHLENREPAKILFDNDNNIIIKSDLLLKLDSEGNTIWEVDYGISSAQDFIVDDDNSIILTGYSYLGTMNNDFVTVKISAEGQVVWNSIFSNQNIIQSNDAASCIIQGQRHEIYVTGRTNGGGQASSSSTIIYDTNGNELQIIKLDSLNYDFHHENKVFLGNNNSIYVCGNIGTTNQTYFGFFIAKIAPYTLTNINNSRNNLSNEIMLAQNYPNPFNPETTIEYDVPNSCFVNISIYNSIGEKIETLVNEYKNKGKYTTKFYGKNLASGTYFYKLTTDEKSEIKKMQYLK